MPKIKEIWIYHHSHLDVGYTHPQPVLWELQKQYIDQAIHLCEMTEHEKECMRFRWTCEATEPVIRWLESASPSDVERMSRFVRNGQICLTALSMHTAPLSSADQLARMLYPVKSLREQFGAKVNTAINHDINGQPWTFAQILLDAGIELYTMGINIHFGGIPLPRPLVFRWKAPDGRELLTFNGEHYSVFTQICELWEKDLGKMKRGIGPYLNRLEQMGYPHDFVYLSTTNVPMLDNTPPDEELLEMVRRWNEAGEDVKLKLATPEMLLEKIKQLPQDTIPVFAGDWTDYWNFGAASSAEETRLTRRTKYSLRTTELLAAFQGGWTERDRAVWQEAWKQLELYDEHTWGANESVTNPDSLFTRTLWMHKAHPAYQANSLSGFALATQLERLAGNPLQSGQPEGLLLVNPTQWAQKLDLRVSDEFMYAGRHVSANRFKFQQNNGDTNWQMPAAGVLELPPFSWKKIKYDQLRKAETPSLWVTDSVIDTPYYTLEVDPKTGRIGKLYDKRQDWHVLDPESPYTLFQFVHEKIDALRGEEKRTTLFPRDIEKCNNSISCWNHNWPANRRGAERLVECRIDRHDSGATLVLRWEAPGTEGLEQKITLFTDNPRIELIASFYKTDERTPESIYFAIPLNLKGWRATFDSAGTFVELDKEQLPGSCRDYVTVDRAVSVHDDNRGVTLACPDAPLVQIGGFHFGQELKHVSGEENPLLLAWPVNNYWDTNFRASQPGKLTFKYELTVHGGHRVDAMLASGTLAGSPVQMFPAVYCPSEEAGTFLAADNNRIEIAGVKPAEDGNGIVIRLQNISSESKEDVNLAFPGRSISYAAITDGLETDIGQLPSAGDAVSLSLEPRQLLALRVQW
ncbi:hypothetical protein D3P08_05920 [Paenibacillus nanensis]|uniref:Glycoside hydrolase family 38 N-terminal domain-containing protein n=1 Tax=Paenibacillus nanensis TaxID=393251 RepID=A0A3A1VGG4_9BACL|nr:glycosyl hydrolase-related protein [Paenibacillus nanensis]RIX59667.1 hypothetical protein D3P08_05920 [Paenibacillus nanensis]